MYWFLDKLLFAYLFAVAAFLLLRLFLNPVKQRTSAWLDLANGIGAVILYIHLAYVLYEAFRYDPYHQYRLRDAAPSPVYHFDLRFGAGSFIRLILLTGIVPLLFIFRKYRQRVSLSLVMIVLLLFYQYFDGVVAVMNSYYRDYLPSSWSVYYMDSTKEHWWTVLFSVLFFVNCWLLSEPQKSTKT